jgi:hypothetical protein
MSVVSGHSVLFDDHFWEKLYWISQIASALFQFILVLSAVVAAIFAYNQVISHKLFELVKFLQDEKFRDARRIVIKEIYLKKGTNWWLDPKFEAAASTCAGHYDVVGCLLRFKSSRGLQKLFIRSWADSIVRTHQVLDEFIKARRAENGAQYEDFEWLYRRAKVRHPTVGVPWPPVSDQST